MNGFSVFPATFDEQAVFSATHIFRHICGK
jgi:hypothetical protein